MKRALFAAVLLAFTALAAAPKLPDKPLASEAAFVNGQTKILNAKYKTPADAEKAGYFRYTNEDNTGAISYVNLQWDSSKDPQNPQPSQLWYDVKGRLIGADYSVPYTDANAGAPPKLWGLNPGRWATFKHAHVHYVLKDDKGTMVYGKAVSAKDFVANGGDLNNPAAAPLVKMKKADDADDVVKVFTFPAQYDVEIWVVPNPLGAFAEKNPMVKPSKNAETGM
ncbi:MAG TPA: hypothetical protein VFL13_13200 [Candidatus Baltobacteraceae bacterium]|nr:hypothetical protein [Candidatus Baltobacteraceae bacterium]